ncbi:MAG: glycosyl transferase [Gammaproteobacteria bacterium]|nr:MAG: glycosyl transferase [Gammaproteobacteria bacterium]
MNRVFSDWRFAWFLILLPVALFLPALPIDETRYLTVAWEMRLGGDALLLHLNGAPYSDKGPLLFWLINVAWLAAGLHVWIVRLGVLVASLISLVLLERLVRRLATDEADGGRALATRATMILAGILYFALFASAIMFDVVLTTCVLLALHGVLDLDAQRWRRGMLIFALGLGLGILTKGPVVLLDAGLVALFAPWWSVTARAHKARWYGAMLAGVVGGAALALAWAIPAALHGGPDYANAIFVRQTVGRVAKSFAHQRPYWWYFMVLPLMVLPWTLSLRAPWHAWRDGFAASKAARFGIAWFLPAFVAFCFVSGKQPHYLLPLLPGLALYFAQVQGDALARVRGRIFGALLVMLGSTLFAAPYAATHAAALPMLARLVQDGSLTPNALAVIGGIWPLWGALLALLGIVLIVHPRVHTQLRVLALAGAATASIGMLTLAQAVGPTVDVSATAARIKAAQDAGKPVAHLGWHHGLFGFPGQLTQPLQKVDLDTLYTWCAAHPDGEVITFYTKYGIPVKPELEIPYRLGRILVWRAADLCAGPRPVAPRDDEDETPSD